MNRLLLFLALIGTTQSFSQMTMNGTAVPYGVGCNCYQLTTETAGIAGAIWSPNTIDLNNDFDMTFQIYVGDNDVWGADGMAFVLQQNPSGIGSPGNGIGYASPYGAPPISNNNFIIEIDVWDNGAAVPTDVPEDHIAISENGSQHHDLLAPTPFPANQEVSDNAYHTYRVSWDASLQIIAVYWEGSAIPLVALNYNIIANTFGGSSNVYWGWTAGTGGVVNETRVCTNSSASFTSDLTSVCPGLPVQFTDGSTSDLNLIDSWSWDFGDGTPNAISQNPSHSFNAPGTYNVVLTMTDGFGCDYTANTSITVLDSVDLTMDSTGVTCYGYTDGSGTAVPTSGSGPYNYTWNDPGTQSTQTATGLAPGVYSVTVVDDLGCVGIDSIQVTEPLEITLNMDSTDASCNGGTDGTASATVNNGVSPFSYLWDDPGSQTTSTATGLPAGVYTVVVTDFNGCMATDSVEVLEAPGITLSMDSVNVTCFGGSDGLAIVNVTSGTGPFTYVWDDPGAQTSDTAAALPAGMYTVTVTGGAGCVVSDSVSITEPAAITTSITSVDVDCFGESTGEATVTASNGVTPYTYQWDDPASQTTATATLLSAGDYTVIVTDSNGCTASNSVTITQNSEITGSVVTTEDTGADDGTVDLTVNGGTTPYTYSWSNGSTTEDLTGVPSGTYDVVVTDALGCTYTQSSEVGLILELELPSAMSPNGDGLNDTFYVIGLNAYPQNKLVVTNRWGNVVYETNDYTNNWTGVNMDGENLPEGVYFVVLELGNGEQESTYLEIRRK
ncbi:MAG: gliding motility-associated C-terminal domain-containing protein [Crocinitomicaceae bacterium]|nr:gliding motility-associated C-terminal domain-containing protein [Crocinitomicaceae bacterium]